MLAHSLFVVVALTGLKLEWKSPPREAAAVPWRHALAQLAPMSGVIALLAVGIAVIDARADLADPGGPAAAAVHPDDGAHQQGRRGRGLLRAELPADPGRDPLPGGAAPRLAACEPAGQTAAEGGLSLNTHEKSRFERLFSWLEGPDSF